MMYAGSGVKRAARVVAFEEMADSRLLMDAAELSSGLSRPTRRAVYLTAGVASGLGRLMANPAHVTLLSGGSPERVLHEDWPLVYWSAMKLTELKNEVLQLDPPTRAWLAEVLLRSLDELSEREVEALWLDEAKRRERAWDAGEVEGIPAEQVMRELRSGSE